jgi:hypothetical protein
MSSESGLKQRKVASTHLGSNDTKQNTGSESHHNSENEGAEENNEEYDADSKETRLTLMEEILLLGLKDREVIIVLFLTVRFQSSLKFF